MKKFGLLALVLLIGAYALVVHRGLAFSPQSICDLPENKLNDSEQQKIKEIIGSIDDSYDPRGIVRFMYSLYAIGSARNFKDPRVFPGQCVGEILSQFTNVGQYDSSKTGGANLTSLISNIQSIHIEKQPNSDSSLAYGVHLDFQTHSARPRGRVDLLTPKATDLNGGAKVAPDGFSFSVFMTNGASFDLIQPKVADVIKTVNEQGHKSGMVLKLFPQLLQVDEKSLDRIPSELRGANLVAYLQRSENKETRLFTLELKNAQNVGVDVTTITVIKKTEGDDSVAAGTDSSTKTQTQTLNFDNCTFLPDFDVKLVENSNDVTTVPLVVTLKAGNILGGVVVKGTF